MAVELRAPLFVQQGRYDALDLRTMIGGTRGAHVGVAGPTALLVEKVDHPTPRVSVAAGSVWLPDDVAVSHKGAVHFANLDASIQLQCSTPKPGEAARTDLVVAFADPDSVPAGPLLMDIRTTADQYMQPVTYAADGTPYAAAAASGTQVTKEGAKGWSIAVLAESTPGARDWPVPSNSVRLAQVNIAQTGITGIEDIRFVPAGQLDTTPLRQLRTAGAQGLAQVAAGAPAEQSGLRLGHDRPAQGHRTRNHGPGRPRGCPPRPLLPGRGRGMGRRGMAPVHRPGRPVPPPGDGLLRGDVQRSVRRGLDQSDGRRPRRAPPRGPPPVHPGR